MLGVVALGVVVDDVVVDWVLVDALGAAAAPAIPATAPPVARAATTMPVRMMLALLIREPPMIAGVLTQTMLEHALKRSRTRT